MQNLSGRRHVPNALVWMYNKDGRSSVKSAYKVAVQLQRGDEWTEYSGGSVGKNV